MVYKDFSMLFVGDAETTERRWWLQHDPSLVSNCSILKLAHHGSRNGTDARWLSVVKPELAVASLGKNNDYGHPHPETLSLLRRTGIPLLRTDQVGTITIESDGNDWKLLRPNLGTRGHPTQTDVDRVAANAPDDESVTRTTKRAR
jgi:beta-lactamase superfamily II metal-dependent hydrolase